MSYHIFRYIECVFYMSHPIFTCIILIHHFSFNRQIASGQCYLFVFVWLKINYILFYLYITRSKRSHGTPLYWVHKLNWDIMQECYRICDWLSSWCLKPRIKHLHHVYLSICQQIYSKFCSEWQKLYSYFFFICAQRYTAHYQSWWRNTHV